MVHGANMLVDVQRLRQPGSGQMLLPDNTPFIAGEPARVSQAPRDSLLWISPELAVKTPVLFVFDEDTDVVETDHIIRIVEIGDEVTPWPHNGLWPNPNEQWVVRKVIDREGPVSPERWAYVERVLLGGPFHRT